MDQSLHSCWLLGGGLPATRTRDIITNTLTATRKLRDRRDGGVATSQPHELRLLPAWAEPFDVFLENLSDFIQGLLVRDLEPSSVSYLGFWRDIDLQSPIPWRGLMDSAFVHAALLGLLYAVSIWPQAGVHLADSHSYRAIDGYQLSPYLPELHGAPTHRKHGGRADPVPARQEIRSLPDEPDNQHQTIVTPPTIKLRRDVELPNMVGYKQPTLASSSVSAILQLPVRLPEMAPRAPVIVQSKPGRAHLSSQSQSAPEAGSLSRGSAPNLAQLLPQAANPALPVPQVVQRAPEIVQSKPQRALPSVQPRVVQSAPEIGSMNRGSTGNLAQLLPPVSSAMPAAPHAGDAQTPQVVALSAHPAELNSPVAIPEGNRRGVFAASPAGHANATGTPGAGESSGVGAHDASGAVNAPAGISVGAPPSAATAVAAPNAPSSKPGTPDPELRSKLLAAMRSPALASIPPRQAVSRETPQESSGPRNELENHVFAGRRSYTLVVNMPNLNSYTGSWIIRYVDRGQGLVASPIAAPEVVRKADPAYPGDLINDRIQGTVILTAIIHADGSVSDIAVAKSLYPQLDQNAVEALSRWVFRPALKDGQAIDLDALITVPFRTK